MSQAEGEPAFPPCGGRSGEGVGHLCLRQGDVPRAGPVLAQGLRRCERLPRATSGRLTASALGDASALAGRVAEALPRRERGLAEAARAGCLAAQTLSVPWLSAASRLASHREEVRASATRPRGVGPAAVGGDGGAGPASGGRASRSPRPPGPRPGRRPRQAPAPGPRPPRPGHAVWHDGPARAGPCRALHGDRDVSRHGDDVLTPAGGGGAGTRRSG